MLESGKKQTVKKADVILLVVVLITAGIMLFFRQFIHAPGGFARVSYDGAPVAEIPLSEKGAAYYLFVGQNFFSFTEKEWQAANLIPAGNAESSYNAFVCRDGEIRMIQSNCPDLICVHHRAISRTGENIICLPHGVVIEIVGARGQELDGVVY